MKAAAIVPISALHLIEDFTYHLILAHIFLSVPEYASFYKAQRQKPGRFLILDNSVHELGRPMPTEHLKLAVKELQPDVLVIPDSIWNAEENLHLAYQFEEEVEELQNLCPGLELMTVPHGLYAEELETNLHRLLELDYITYVGLMKGARRLGLRPKLAIRAKAAGKKVHFLGIWEDPIVEVLEGKEVGGITGIDSSYPARLGLIGRKLRESKPTPPSLNFFVDSEDYNSDWLRQQLEAYKRLVEDEVAR